MALLLTETPRDVAGLLAGAARILAECGFETRTQDGWILAADTAAEPAYRMAFWCCGELSAQAMDAMTAGAETEDLIGLLCLRGADGPLPDNVFTWASFNAYFQKPWLEKRLQALSEAVQPLLAFTDPFSSLYDDLYAALDEEDQWRFSALTREYDGLPVRCNAFMGALFWLHYNMDELARFPAIGAYLDDLTARVKAGVDAFCRFYQLDRPR
jgi:hypothetical protein